MSVLPALEGVASLQGQGDGPGARWIHVKPADADAVAGCLKRLTTAGWATLCGRPRELPETSPAREIAFVDLSGLAAVVDHQRQDQVVTVETGITLSELDSQLALAGQWLPVSIPERATTVSDLIASGDGGCLEQQFGGPRDLVLGMDVALSTGQTIKCGGRVVKNVTGYDLQKLFIGSHGWLGVPVRAHLRLSARPESVRTVVVIFAAAAAALDSARGLAGSGLPLAALEAVDSGWLRSHLPEEVARAIAGGGVDADAGAAVVVQVCGHDALTGELLERLAELTATAARAQAEVSRDVADGLLAELSARASGGGRSSLTLSAPGSFASALLGRIRENDGPVAWQARVGRGRLTLTGVPDRQAMLARAAALAADSGETVAGALWFDGPWLFRAVRLPDEDPARLALNRALKGRFDPSGNLNPLVSL